MNFDFSDEAIKDCKKLSKKFFSLSSDLEELKKLLSIQPLGVGKHFVILKNTEQLQIVKGRLFCRSLKKSSLRVIFSADSSHENILFLEIYFKGNKEREDEQRIKNYLKRTEDLS